MKDTYRPLIPVNPQGLDEIALALLNGLQQEEEKDRNQEPPAPINIQNPEKYLILPGKTHGKYSYADTLVAMDRTHQGVTWENAHKALAAESAYMLTIRQFADFLSLVKSGRAFNGKGKIVDKNRLDQILDDVMTVRNPWRSEWLDAKFESRGGIIGVGSKMHIHYGHRLDASGNLKPAKSEQLEPYLETDKKPGINAEQWLRDANSYGLPKPSIAQGDLWYWYPRSGCVARFYADSGGAGLSCDWNPAYSDSDLGVRAARAKN